jgi:7,8-dihydropterin-6-yl-methyl-4-(beta-D-ribofuranosyl)aminobenzene 5'-phosphate synthase
MINNLTVTQLVENTVGGPGLLAEHGIAFFIEADGHCLLFDTGQGLALVHNAEQLDIRMESVDAIILSHGHYDHAGGLIDALEMTGPVEVYLHPQALTAKFNRNGREIGAPITDEVKLTSLARGLTYTKSPTEIIPGIHATGEIPRIHKIEDTGGPFYQDSECTQKDALPDDQALYIKTSKGLIVLLGCGHSGVINTLDYIQRISGEKTIYAVMGGMHLLRATTKRLVFTGDNLKRMAVRYLAPNHCTGLDAVCYFKNRFPDTFHEAKVGARHSFGNK